MNGRRALLYIVRALLGGAVLVVCAAGLRRIEWHALGAILRDARVELVVYAALLNFGHLFFKAERWRLLLSPVAQVRRLRLFYYLIVCYAVATVLPGRADEVVRVILLRRRDQVASSASVGVAAAEKLLELLGLVAILAPLPFLLTLPRWANISLGAAGIGGFGALWLSARLTRRTQRAREAGRLGALWEQIRQGMRSLSQPRLFAKALGWSIVANLADGVEVWLVLIALGIHVPWPTVGVVLLAINLAIAIPSTPAHLGAFEAGAVLGLRTAGVPLAPALAFALVYHVMQIGPILLAGLSGIRLAFEAPSAVAE